MTRPDAWGQPYRKIVGAHEVFHMSIDEANVQTGVNWAASVLPRQYTSGIEAAAVLASLGKASAAKFLEGKLPTTSRTRSGELGEILGTQFASRELGYRMIARLRWKDSREMPMRGDDLVGVRDPGKGPLVYLKGEAKSRARLSKSVLEEAETALLAHRGLPSPHALGFLASRLRETGEPALGMRIHDESLNDRIRQSTVTHLLYTLSGSNPRKLLTDHTQAYRGRIRRIAAGLQVAEHQVFIEKVYEKVIRDARAS